MTEIDHLTEDDTISGQSWVCVSFLSPEGLKNCTTRGLKIRGVFATQEEANTKAAELQKKDPNFHVFVGEVGKWLPWDPDVNSIKDQKYLEKELNEIMIAYNKSMELAAQKAKDRKAKKIKKAAVTEQQKLNPTKTRLQQKLAMKKNMANIEKQAESQLVDSSDDSEELKQQEQSIKTEKEELSKTNNEIKQQEQNLESLEGKMARIQQLYDQINKK